MLALNVFWPLLPEHCLNHISLTWRPQSLSRQKPPSHNRFCDTNEARSLCSEFLWALGVEGMTLKVNYNPDTGQGKGDSLQECA